MRIFTFNRVFGFMRLAPTCAALSAVAVLATLIGLFYPGPKLGTDFIGGTEIEVAFKQPVPADTVRSALDGAGLHDADVVEVRTPGTREGGHYILRVSEVSNVSEEVQRQAESRLCYGPSPAPDCPPNRLATEVKFSPGGDRVTARYQEPADPAWIRERLTGIAGLALRPSPDNPRRDERQADKVVAELLNTGDAMFAALKSKLGPDVVPDAPLRVEWVGPKAGAQLRNAALQSIAIALVAIMIYVGVRFDLRFAPGAVICLIHDALIAVGALLITRKEIDLTVIAALLTIIGFSVNDTVVIYDRVRENARRLRNTPFPQIIDLSVSEMLGRTIITSGTAIMSLVAFLIWGTSALQDFAFTLIVGMVSGVYSTVFVALPLTHWLDRTLFAKRGTQQRRAPAPRAKRELNPL